MRIPTLRAAGLSVAAVTFLTTAAFSQTTAPAVPKTDPNVPYNPTDTEIVALVIAVDENEVATAKAAERQELSTPTRDFAKMVREQHGKNMKDMQKLANKLSLAPSATFHTDRVRREGQEELTELKTKTGPGFEKAYLSHMEDGQKKTLVLLDSFIEKADNEELRQQLRRTREQVAMHLKQAETLNSGLAAQVR